MACLSKAVQISAWFPGAARGVAATLTFILLAGCGDNRSVGDSLVEETTGKAAAFEYVEATIEDVHDALQSGQVTCVDIVSGYLARIDAYDKKNGVNAIIFRNPRAIPRAVEMDEALAAGKDLGALYCVPVLLKDNFDTHDMPTSGGSVALKNSTPPDDAFSGERNCVRLMQSLLRKPTWQSGLSAPSKH